MNIYSKLMIICLITILVFQNLYGQQKSEKKEKLQWEVPEFEYALEVVYHPGKDKYYVANASYGYPFTNGKNKKDEVQFSYGTGTIYEVSPYDFNNRIALPIEDLGEPYPIALVGDSLYICHVYDVYGLKDKHSLIGYDLNTSTTFTTLYPDDSLNISPFYDAVVVGTDIYYSGTSRTTSFIHKFVKFDTQNETFTILDLPYDSTNKITGMYYDEEQNRIIFDAEKENIKIQSLDLNSSTVTHLKSTDISWTYGITADTSGFIYFVSQNWHNDENNKLWKIDNHFENEPELIFEGKSVIQDFRSVYFEKRTNTILAPADNEIIVLKLLQYPPELLFPANGASNIETTPSFDWILNPNAEYYEFQLSERENFDSLLIERELYRRSFIDVDLDTILSQNTTYFWRVKAKNDYFETEWSSSTFTTTTLSKAVVDLVFPPNDTSFSGNSMTFTWDTIHDAEQYLIYLKSVDGYNNWIETTTSNTISINDLYSTKYVWNVKVSKGNGSCDWSESRTFTAKRITLDNNYLLYPAYDAEGTETGVEFNWESVHGATGYNIRLYTHRDYIDYLGDPHQYFQSDSNSIFIDSLQLRTKYYWSVRAYNDTIIGRWTSEEMFITSYIEVIPPELIFPPQHGEDKTGKPKLQWNDMGAQYYEVNLYEREGWDYDDLSDFIQHGHYLPSFLINPTLQVKNVEDTVYYITKKLKDKTLYVWRVKANYNGDYSKWSDVRAFKTNFSTPVEDNPSKENDFNIYPNPATSNATAEFYLTKPGIVDIRVYNIYGSLVNEYSLGYITEGNQMYVMNLEGTVSGMYCVVINIGGEKKLVKMVKY